MHFQFSSQPPILFKERCLALIYDKKTVLKMTQKQSFHLLRHSQNEAKTVEKTHELSIVPQKVGDKQFGKYKKNSC